MSPALEATSPSAQYALAAQDALHRSQFAAKQARAQPPELSFPVAKEKTDREAQEADLSLTPEQQFQSEHQQSRILAGIGAPLALPAFSPEYDLTEEDQQDIDDTTDDLIENQQASRQDDYSQVKAQSREKNLRAEFANKQLEATGRKLAKEIYSMIPGLAGDVDTPLEDGGITLGGAATTSFYQLVMTFWDQAGDAVEASPVGQMLPPRFNKRSIIGWGMIVNAVFILLWSVVAFMIATFPVLIIIVIAGGAVGGLIAGLASLF